MLGIYEMSIHDYYASILGSYSILIVPSHTHNSPQKPVSRPIFSFCTRNNLFGDENILPFYPIVLAFGKKNLKIWKHRLSVYYRITYHSSRFFKTIFSS